MGCEVLVGKIAGNDREKAVFLCDTTGQAFGPVMEGAEEAERFMSYLQKLMEVPVHRTLLNFKIDPREYSTLQLQDLYARFRKERCI